METNPYDITVPWMPEQNQWIEDRSITIRNSQPRPSLLETSIQQLRGEDQKLKRVGRMSKAEALALVSTLKKWLIVASLVSFGVFSGLVAQHQADAVANQIPADPSQLMPDTAPSSGGFFDQQGGDNFGPRNGWQGPVSGSSVSH
jgi:hypothetical protein